ncbi:Hpt domain-containing protein [Haliangium ochraceum]|uniref:Putative CheA signal transduction histidine kinase n=1 Tax=Haliangium ochraceum (strain DSM 14365 / JCM 11303 / SMP-2) TaxID=502025 RepID=D0LWI0_HALO1|nr:Hpt domain-containing protein [Haliangium ochraceum]ACY17630.1 putative CheA signal transduction histidine kinase [Haliangium ochraceum DSM 14365]
MATHKEEWLDRMTAMLQLGPEDLLEIAEMFFEGLDERVENIAKTGHADDLEAMSRLAHGLKGDAANIGFLEISQIAKQLEHQGRARAVENFEEQVAALRAAARSTKESLDL